VFLDLFLADWETWERQGLIDELILQYIGMTNIFISELELPEVQAAASYSSEYRHFNRSTALFSADPNQVEAVRKQLAGVSFFSTKLCGIWRREPAQRQSTFQGSSQHRWNDRIFWMVGHHPVSWLNNNHQCPDAQPRRLGVGE